MQIVIDIDEEDYNVILANADFYKEQHWGVAEVWDAIVGGTPLPKGHGRLKDIDKVEQLLDLDKPDNVIAKALKNIIESVPTIIDADRSEE